MQEESYLSPKEAARQLDISPSGLRRLASLYSDVHGNLPRDPNTDARLWPQEAVERLKAARVVVDSGKYPSIKEALEALEHGLDVSTDLTTPLAPDLSTGYEALVVTMKEMFGQILIQQNQIETLQSTVTTLSKQLTAPKEDEGLKVIHEEILALAQELKERKQLEDTQQARIDTLEREKAALKEELSLQKTEPTKKRPWWKRW